MLCVRKLNKITEVDPEPMMTAEGLLRRPSGKKYLSKIDLTKGYWQILVGPEDLYKTVFVTPDGPNEFLQMPFEGLKKILERLSGADHQEASEIETTSQPLMRSQPLCLTSSRKEGQNKYNGMRHRSGYTHCSRSTCYKNQY